MLPFFAVAPEYTFDVHRFDGLTLRVAGVPVVSGSWFQVYEPDWSKQHFGSSRGGEVKTAPDGTVTLTWGTPDGQVKGTQTYRPSGDTLTVRYRFEWNGPRPVEVEATAGMLSAAALQAGRVEGGRQLDGPAPARNATMSARQIAPDGSRFVFDAPLARVEVSSSRPLTLFDARNYDQEWARNRSLFWLGVLKADVAPGQPLEYAVTWKVTPKPAPAAKPETRSVALRSGVVSEAEAALPPLIPKPKDARLSYQAPIELTQAWRFPIGRVRYWKEFEQALAQRFVLPKARSTAAPLAFDGGITKSGRKPGSYDITITSKGSVSVLGEEDEGLRMGLRRLAAIAFARNGKLWLPTGTLRDEPAVPYRGVHLFVGPEAREFHRRLWHRVLLPMGFNQVVLQCERTDWKSFPIDASEQPMRREELASLFADYRAWGVEPTPLIQSIGHMGWFFAGNRRLDLAFNPENPFTLDVRKPEAISAIGTLWQEAADLLKPKTMHFGCDEIDLRGFPPNSYALTTDLWQRAMPALGEIAEKHGARMMVWGDKGLAPGEAVDAAHGHSKEEAAKRRAAIPKGAWIADWHYRNDPRPETFYPSLQLWRREGYVPIASAWYRQDNVRGFALAAELERAGYLQTTWAGYQSNEANMLRNYDQFAAMVLAGDYTWSARREQVKELGYDPGEVFRRLFYGRPTPVVPIQGQTLGDGKPFQIETLNFRELAGFTLRSILTREGLEAPSEVTYPLKAKARYVAVALESTLEGSDGEAVGEVEVVMQSGARRRFPVVYGRHVRAASDGRTVPMAPQANGRSGVVLDLGQPHSVASVSLRSVGPVGGLRLHGLSIW